MNHDDRSAAAVTIPRRNPLLHGLTEPPRVRPDRARREAGAGVEP